MVANENREGYKKTELGWIPEYWNVVELKSVCTEFNVPMRDKPKVFDGNVPWCRIEDIQGRYIYGTTSEQYVSAETITDMNLKINPKGSIICSCSASLGVVAMVENPLITNQTFIGIVLKDSICREYLYYYLLSCKQRFKRIAGGTTIPYISREKFENFKIVYPSIMEQEKVGRILNTVDLTIEEIDKKLFALTELKRALAKKLLSEGIGHEDFKDSEVGRIPLSWSIKDISQISSSCNNGFVGTAAPFYTDEETGIPYMMGNNVRANRLDLRDRVFITKEFTDSNPRARINTGDTLTVQSGHIGTTCVVPEEFNNAFCHALIITKYKESVNSDYVAYYLNSDIGMKRLQNIFVGTTIKHINTKDFVKFKIPIPDINEQIKISNILKDFDKQISQYQQQKSDYTQLKAGLMQQLLTGKIRVKCDK